MGMKENSFIFKVMMFLFGAVFGWGFIVPLSILGIVLGLALTATIILAVFGIPLIVFSFAGIGIGLAFPFIALKKPEKKPEIQVQGS